MGSPASVPKASGSFLANYQGLTLDNGHRRVVRNGYLPEREIPTGIGPVAIKMPKVRDRGKAKGGRKVQFQDTSTILEAHQEH
jgi:putative transposase